MNGAAPVDDPRPWRPNVGVALFDHRGLVFAGKSFSAGPEIVLPGFEWQMPQGGIERDEDIEAAARRELLEETNVRSAAFLGATAEWWRYDFPPYDGPAHKLTPFRGQEQRWAAFRFTGDPSEINVLAPGGGEMPEFSAWDWLPLAEMPGRVVPYKRPVYERVAVAFARFARPA